MKLTPFYIGLFSFLIGVFLYDFLQTPLVFLCVFLVFPFSYFFTHTSTAIYEKKVWASIVGFLCGSLYLFFSLPNIDDFTIVKIAKTAEDTGKSSELSGYINTFPKIKEDKIQFEVLVDEEKLLVQKYIQYNRNAEVNYEKLQYGDFIHVSGRLELPEKTQHSIFVDIPEFQYDRFLAKDGIFVLMKNPIIMLEKETSEERREDSWREHTMRNFWKYIFSLRRQFEENIKQKLAYPENEYALGITLGDESGIPQKIIEDFNTTGLRHLLALSGMNITIIIVFLSGLFFFLPKIVRILCITFFIFVFVMLTGASSSVVRAAVMGVVGIIALQSGRKLQPLHVLIFALSCITIYNPFLLYSDISLQFSVLAVLGLMYIEPLLYSGKVKSGKKKNELLQVLSATLAAQIAVLPLMIVFFEQVSLISPITNLLVVPISTLAMILVFATALPFVGWVFMPFAYFLLHSTLFIAEIFANIPNASIITSGYETIMHHHILFILLYYSILIVVLQFLYRRKKSV